MTFPAPDAVDLFAGPGGWDVAARSLGLHVLGIEWDHAACKTRRAAGLPTIESDVREYGPADFPSVQGLIASPPCPTFSMSGNGSGRRELEAILAGVKTLSAEQEVDYSLFSDDRTGLTLEPLRWALAAARSGHPFRWLAFEQVPAVLPIWQAMGDVLHAESYGVATGVLRTEDFGVPQTRKRAILIARLDGKVALPVPIHDRPVTMHEALGWGYTDKFAPAVTAGGFQTGGWEPFANARIRRELGRRLTVREAAILQTFPADYPWQGTKGQQGGQIGNAVPPLLARAVLAAVV